MIKRLSSSITHTSINLCNYLSIISFDNNFPFCPFLHCYILGHRKMPLCLIALSFLSIHWDFILWRRRRRESRNRNCLRWGWQFRHSQCHPCTTNGSINASGEKWETQMRFQIGSHSNIEGPSSHCIWGGHPLALLEYMFPIWPLRYSCLLATFTKKKIQHFSRGIRVVS